MDESVVIQHPAAAAQQLILLFHGVGADAQDLAPLGRVLAAEFPQACIASIGALAPSDLGVGRQWFAVQGLTEENRPARVAAALPRFLDIIRSWQDRSGVGVEGTALVGFSQGAIMALAAAASVPALAGRVLSIAGRFALLPEAALPGVTLHLFHGKADPVIAYRHTVVAAERLVSLGADVTADVLPFVGHEISADLAVLLAERLRTHIPRRLWEEALRADPGAPK